MSLRTRGRGDLSERRIIHLLPPCLACLLSMPSHHAGIAFSSPGWSSLFSFFFFLMYLVFLLSTPHGIGNLSSLTKDRTCALCSGSAES